MDTSGYLAIVRRRVVVVLLCVLAGLMGAFWTLRSTTDVYRSSTRLFLNVPPVGGVSDALQGVQLSGQLMASYVRVATSRAMAELIVEDLDLPIRPADLQGRMSADSDPNTLLLTLSVDDTDPDRARTIANAAADAFAEIVADLEGSREGAVEPRVIDEAELPTSPVRPQPRRDLLLGGGVGLALGLGLALLMDSLDRSLRSPAETASLAGAPVLAIVPKRPDADKHPIVTVEEAGSRVAEAYRTLRTAVRFVNVESPLRSLVISSPSAAEGKTSTAVNLAIALSQAGENVVLVDADLRRTCLADLLGVSGEVGLTSVITGEVPLADALVRIGKRFSFLPAGVLPPNPSEILGSESMARISRDLRGQYDVVIFDTPPILPVTDTHVLATQSDGVILVARFGRTSRTALTEARRRLDVVGAKVAGCVLLGVPPSADYSEEYAYSAYRPRSERRSRWRRRAKQPLEPAV